MSDTTPQSYTFTITLLTLPAAATTPVASTWQVTGANLNLDRDGYVITDGDGAAVAYAPLGALIVRNDALVPAAPATAA